MSSRNDTNHFEVIDANTGNILMIEKCRNTFGGFVNMQRRIGVALGATPGRSGMDHQPRSISGDPDNMVWEVNGTKFRLVEVCKL